MLKRIMALLGVGIIGAMTTQADAQTTATKGAIYEIPVQPMKADGGTSATSLEPYKGKVMLIVNVASKCGYTKQYTGLEALYDKYKDQGLVVLGFPSNDFKGQEPGTEAEILEFCKSTYDVSFPLFGKVTVTGQDKAPLYRYLTEGDHAGKGEVTWNFNKYLVDREGNIVAHYESKVKPEDPLFVAKIEELLGKK